MRDTFFHGVITAITVLYVSIERNMHTPQCESPAEAFDAATPI